MYDDDVLISQPLSLHFGQSQVAASGLAKRVCTPEKTRVIPKMLSYSFNISLITKT